MLKIQLQKALHFAKSKFTITTKGVDKNCVDRKSSRMAIIYPVDEQLILKTTKNSKNQRCQKKNRKEENEEENNNIFYSNFLIYHLN
ncbi:unnamed protein product [Meloidogyne enterolobii]|uniref:Uncharacterized protein n=1 Tax=Meloidogyne enterolobii TaxID=390850 RepID=A0ACB1AF79_MELEN